jgi:hypothetical protein
MTYVRIQILEIKGGGGQYVQYIQNNTGGAYKIKYR